MAPTRSRGIPVFNMSSQLNTRFSKRPGLSAASAKPTYEGRLLGSEKIQLLKAPGIDSDVMWKQQCFESVYNRLRGKLSDSCNADAIISVFNTHFPISTLSAEDQARMAVIKFRAAFGDLSYLKPTAFLNRNGEDKTSFMYQHPRPANVCHLGVTAEISMCHISKAFDREMTFTVEYFLPLPQTCGRSSLVPAIQNPPHTKTKAPTLGSAEVLDSNVFSPPSKSSPSINLTDKIFNKEKDFTTPKLADKRASTIEVLIDDKSLEGSIVREDQNSLNNDLENENSAVQDNKEVGITDKDEIEGSVTDKALDMESMLLNSPKSTTLIMGNRALSRGKKGLAWTYEGPIGVLDNEDTFREEIVSFDNYYELLLNTNGARNVSESKSLIKKIHKIENIVQLRVFCFEFKKSYVGNAGSNAAQATATIQNCASRLRSIKMISKDYTSNQMTVLTPDTVYSKMLDLVQLLPDDASIWGFCLPWIYLEALSYNLQEDLRDSGYLPPPPTDLLTKDSQLEAMVDCRDKARLANKKIRDLKRHVARAMNAKMPSQHRSNFLSEDNDAMDGRNDEEPFDEPDIHPDNVPVFFNNNSRAEQTMANELYKKRKREGLPEDFHQKRITKDNAEFPCHPLEISRCSDFPIGFRGCLGCGSEEHQFSSCKTRLTAAGRNYFHFQLHCHHPDVFFKNHDKFGNFKKNTDSNGRKLDNRDGVGRGNKAVVPSWLKSKNDGLSRYRNAENDSAPQYIYVQPTEQENTTYADYYDK